MRFNSKIDWWAAALLVVIPVAVLLLTAAASQEEGSWAPFGVTALTLFLIYAGLLFPLYYELGDTLLIRFGVMRARIAYDEITEVRPSRSPWSSAALSLDRLRIQTPKRWVLISPADRERFLRELEARAPQLRREGDRLVAQPPP